MVLSNKKLKQKLRTQLSESLPKPDSQLTQQSFKSILTSITQKPNLSKREIRRVKTPVLEKSSELGEENGGLKENKKRKRDKGKDVIKEKNEGKDLSEKKSSHTTDTNSGKLVMFSGEPDFSTGAHALLNKDCELGRGGFGAVYRTVLGDGRSVAIKKLTVSSLVKSQDDFEREVKKLGKIHHANLVALEGYYWTPSLQLLIYEYVSGGNLYKHLHEGEDEDGNKSSLTWKCYQSCYGRNIWCGKWVYDSDLRECYIWIKKIS